MIIKQDAKRSNEVRKRDKLNIIAYLDPTEGACNISKYFIYGFINSGKLHIDVRQVKTGVISIKRSDELKTVEGVRYGFPKVILYSGHVELLRQEGNRINIPALEQYILKHIGVLGDSKKCKCGKICNLEKCNS